MKKRLLTILLALALASLFAIPALAVVEKSDSYYAADYADVLDQSLEDRIIAANGDLEYYCDGAQIVVATVNYLEGAYADEYAMTLFNDWGVGSASANNGMLLLMVPGENKAWLTVGSGISGSFTSGMADDYFDEYFWEDFDSGDYNSAAEKMLDALFSWYGSYYGVTAEEDQSFDDLIDETQDTYPEQGTGFSLLSWIWENRAVVVIILIILYYIFRSDRNRYRSYYASRGVRIPPYMFWYMFTGPHRGWRDPNAGRWDDDHRGGPRGSGGGFGGGGHSSGGGFGGFGGFGGGGHSGSGFGGGGFGGGGGGRR